MEQQEPRRKRRAGKRKRSQPETIDLLQETKQEEEASASAQEESKQEEKEEELEQKPPAQWACPACTFLNDAARCFCEMCETPNPTPPKSVALAPDWSCAACTVVNPAAMRVCAVCGTLNPHPPSLAGAESEELSDDSEDEGDAWICRSCDALATGSACPQCLAPRPREEAKRRKKSRKDKKKRERTKMAYGVSIYALKKLMLEPSRSQLVDTLQSLTHTLAMMDASADNEWADGPSFLIRSFGGGGMPSSETSKDPELLTLLASIFGEEERNYPLEVRLLAVQSINYLMKMDRHMFARSKMVETVRLYIANLIAWKDKDASAARSADAKNAQMVVEECLNGLSSSCCTEAFALHELLTRGNFVRYLDFMLILADEKEGSESDFHPSIIMTALGILQKCCMKLRWSANSRQPQRSSKEESLRKGVMFRQSPKKATQDGKLTVELASKLVDFLLRVLQHKHVPLHAKAAKCLLLVFHRAPYDRPEIIMKLITPEVLKKFVAVVVNADSEESEESRLAAISLLLHLFDNRPQLVSLFVKESIYEDLFSGMLPLLQSSSSTLGTSALKLTALLARVVCRKHSLSTVSSWGPQQATKDVVTDTGSQSPTRHRPRFNSLPDPDVLATLLIDFIRADSIPAVSAVLKDGADLNFPSIFDVHGNEIAKPLDVAAEYASLKMVRFLVKRGADVHQVGPNGTPLHIAARAGRCDIAAFLIQCGARVQAKDRNKKTVLDIVDIVENAEKGKSAKYSPPSPMKKLLELQQGLGGIRDYDSDLSENEDMSGGEGRAWFFPSDPEDEYGDEDEDDDAMDDDELEDEDEYYMGYGDEDESGFNRTDRGDEDSISSDEEMPYDDETSQGASPCRNRRLESTGSESEAKMEERYPGAKGDIDTSDTPETKAASTNGKSRDESDTTLQEQSFRATTDEIYGFSRAVMTCLMAVLHDMDIQNVERSVLSTLACVLEMAPSQLIHSLEEKDAVLILDTVHFLLQGGKHREPGTGQNEAVALASETPLSEQDNAVSLQPNSNLPSFILALRILQAMIRKSSVGSSIFHQIERRGIGEQIEHLNDSSASWMNGQHAEAPCNTIFGRVLEQLNDLRDDMLESGTLYLHKLKNLARRLKDFTDSAPQCEKELILVDLVELFEQPNSITTYEFKQSELLPAVLGYLSPLDKLDEGRTRALVRAFERSPYGLKHLILRLQSIITQEETFPLVSFCSGKGRELYPLTRQLKIAFVRPGEKKTTDRNHGGTPVRLKGKSIHSSPLTHFQSFERTVSRCLPVIDADLSVLYLNLVGHPVQKVVDGKWRKFLVVGYDDAQSHHLVKPLDGTDDDLAEMVLHDSQCKLMGDIDVYEDVSLNLQLFGAPDSDHGDGKKKRKNNKRKRKTGSPKEQNDNDSSLLVEVKNSSVVGLPKLPGAWYAAQLVNDAGETILTSGTEQTSVELINSQKVHSVKIAGENYVVRKVPAECLRVRLLHPQVGSVVEVDGALGEVTRVYSSDRSLKGTAHTLLDVKISGGIEKSRVKKERVRFPPKTKGNPKFRGDDGEIEAMSLGRLFPARDSSLLAGSVGDRVWVLPPTDSPVRDLCVVGIIKSFPSGMESIRESPFVVVEVNFGSTQPPLCVKVKQDRVLNFAAERGMRGGRGPSRLLQALQMASERSGPNRLFGGRSGHESSSAIHRAFERVAGQLGGGLGSSNSALDQIRQLISRNSTMSSSNAPSELDTPEQRQPDPSATPNPSSGTTPNEPIGSEIQTEDEVSTSTSSSPSSRAAKRQAKSARGEQTEATALRTYLKTNGAKPKWTCSQFPKVNLVVGFRKCDANTGPSDRIIVSSEFGLQRAGKLREDMDMTSVSVLIHFNQSLQRYEAKPGARQVMLDVFNSYTMSTTESQGSHKKKKRKVSPRAHRKTPDGAAWDINKFMAFMSNMLGSVKQDPHFGHNSTETKNCILFSKFASPESQRRLLGPDEFIALMVHVCQDTLKAKQVLKFFRSLGYSDKLLKAQTLRTSGDDEEKGKVSHTGGSGQSEAASHKRKSDIQALRQPVVLRGFPADQNVLKCVEELRKEYCTRSDGHGTASCDTKTGSLPPWKLTYKLYCDFQVEWASEGSSATTISATTGSPPLPLKPIAALDGKPSTMMLSQGIVTLDDMDSNGTEASRWLDRITSRHTEKGQRGGVVVPDSVASAVRLLCYLFQYRSNTVSLDEALWTSPRLYNKLETQLQDVLSMCSGIYPPWCDALVTHCKFFFPRELREKLFRATSFGCTRSLHWFRHQLNVDENGTESAGDSIPGGIYNQEISISPIPKERVKVHREKILQSAEAVMKMHAKRKAILDVVFVGEKGYGSGVTAAFYSTIAHALQLVTENQKHQYWIPGEDDTAVAMQVAERGADGIDVIDDIADDGAVIRHANGLFPFPHQAPNTKLVDRFRMMGRLAGKALMDERLLPLPLSPQFMKLVVGDSFGLEELETIFLSHGRILYSMFKASKKLVAGEGNVQIDQMDVKDWLDAVGFTFIDPLSQKPLVADGEDIAVTTANLSQYVQAVLELWLNSGIHAQVLAFREGISEVLPLGKLRLLFVPELLTLLCGEDDIKWDVASLLKDTKLAHGYTKDSLPVQYFMEVLEEMPSPERRAFLLYATGCPNLPPGGFQALKPPFEIVRRVVDNVDVDHALPFARTCTNTLHLPAYSSKAVLAKQMSFAIANSRGVIDRD